MSTPETTDAPRVVRSRGGRTMQPALKIVLLYIAFSAGWFFLVDRVLSWLIRNPASLAAWGALKAWSFVALTSLILLFSLRRTLRQLRASEQRWKLLFDSAPDAYYLHDLSGTFVDGNRAAETLTGYQKHELVGKNVFKFDLLAPDDLAKAAELLEQNRQGRAGEPTSYTLKRKDTTHTAVEVRTLPVQVGDQFLVLGIARDITERKRAEERLRESEARFSAVFRASPTAIGISDYPDGAFVEVNDTFLETFGFTREEVIGRTSSELGIWLSREDRLGLIQALRERGRAQQREARFRRKSGELGDLLISAELMVVDGREYLLGMLLDVTSRKRLEAQLFQAQKMEAVGQLAGGVAHDFNNILAAQLLQLQLLERRSDLDPEISTALQELEKGVERAASLTRQLLLFSRRQVMQIQRVDLDELLAGLMKMLKRLLGEHIVIHFRQSPKPIFVDADPGMIEQVIVNLCVNARDAMPGGGTLSIATELVAIPPNAPNLAADTQPGTFVSVTVQDTGSGMDEVTLKRIFEPFFTTKEPGKGTGLGLATAHGITKQHRGWIEVQSAVARGTTFRVFLPAKDPPLVADSGTKPPAIPGGTETILVVEDDSALRLLVRKTLILFGYKVLEASTGAEATEIWRSQQPVHLIFSDMVMPGGCSGLDLAHQMLEVQPAAKVLLASGYSSELPLEIGRLPAGVKFLPKPYTPSALALAIRQSLDTPSR